MTVYRYTSETIDPIAVATFTELGIRERDDLQRLLRDRIDVIVPGALVISEEFSDWEDSRRRIDLFAIDRDANLVVIELKRTEDGGHMELQAVRYAAMVSTITFDRVVDIYGSYLKSRNIDADAEQRLMDFLGWEEPQEDDFGAEVKIVLASAEFSKELTTTVLWLRERDIDIRCVRLRPYGTNEDVLLDVTQIIPLPEATDYQVRVREKQRRERAARESSRDYTRFDVTVDGATFSSLPKRRTAFTIITALCNRGVSPDEVVRAIGWRGNLFRVVDGEVDSVQFTALARQQERPFDPDRWFHEESELIRHDGKTYALTNQWGAKTEHAMTELVQRFKPSNLSFTQSK